MMDPEEFNPEFLIIKDDLLLEMKIIKQEVLNNGFSNKRSKV